MVLLFYTIFFLCFAALFGVLLAFRRTPKKIGKAGELRVAELLSQLPDGYTVFNDVVLSQGERTTQIDHVVVSIHGVFAIETKNYRGDIYGNDDRDQWKQVIRTDVTVQRKWWKTYTYITKNEMYNPVRQAKGHTYALRKILKEFPNLPIIPIVVFVGDCNLDSVNSSSHVLYGKDLVPVILSYQSVFLSDEGRNRVEYLLRCGNRRDEINDKTHIQHVHEIQQNIDIKIAAGICPRCGKPLCERQGKYSRFLGCSGYPKCKYTKNID